MYNYLSSFGSCFLTPDYPLGISLQVNVRFRRALSFCQRGLRVVGSSGLEPPTSRLSGARSNLLSYEPIWIEVTPAPWRRGGDDGIRTHDSLLAGQVLSQLSYTPSVSSPLSLPF